MGKEVCHVITFQRNNETMNSSIPLLCEVSPSVIHIHMKKQKISFLFGFIHDDLHTQIVLQGRLFTSQHSIGQLNLKIWEMVRTRYWPKAVH